MKIKDLTKGIKFKEINGIIKGMIVSFDKEGCFEYAWCMLNLISADIEILSPKKRFGQSGVYSWVKISKDYKIDFIDAPEGEPIKDEYLIPWSDLKKVIK